MECREAHEFQPVVDEFLVNLITEDDYVGMAATTSARAFSSAGVYAWPAGLLGELIRKTLVRGVIAAAS